MFGFEEEYHTIKQGLDFINDDGLYCLIRGSDTTKARKIYKWFQETVKKYKNKLNREFTHEARI